MDRPIVNFPITGVLEPADAAAIILWTDDGRYLMQVRDDIPGIFYPGHYGLFGGAMEHGETMDACAIRELREEVGMDFRGRLQPFLEMTLDFAPFGYSKVARAFYEAEIAAEEAGQVRLGEGRRSELIDGVELLQMKRVSPYDAFALWQPLNRRRSS